MNLKNPTRIRRLRRRLRKNRVTNERAMLKARKAAKLSVPWKLPDFGLLRRFGFSKG